MSIVDLNWKFEQDILVAEIRFLEAAVTDILARTR